MTHSQYILVESANVLWKHLQRHNVRPEEAVTSFRTLRDLGIRLVPNGDLLEDALILEVWPESQRPGFSLCQADVLQSYMAQYCIYYVATRSVSPIIDGKKTTAWEESGFPARFLGRVDIQEG